MFGFLHGNRQIGALEILDRQRKRKTKWLHRDVQPPALGDRVWRQRPVVVRRYLQPASVSQPGELMFVRQMPEIAFREAAAIVVASAEK